MNELAVTEYKEQRVLTTQQIAEAYETNTDTITKNFNRNKGRYTEGKHFICLKGDELREFKANGQIDLLPSVNTFYLWTKKGAFLHAKSLNTDTAWEVYDRLVDNYFDRQDMLEGISPELQAIIMHDKKIQQVEQRVETVKQDLEDFKMDMPILGIEIDKITAAVHKRGVNALGGKESNAYNDRSLRGKVYSDVYRELKRQFGVTTYKAIKRSQCDLAISVIDEYELPLVLADQIHDCNAQMNMGVA